MFHINIIKIYQNRIYALSLTMASVKKKFIITIMDWSIKFEVL